MKNYFLFVGFFFALSGVFFDKVPGMQYAAFLLLCSLNFFKVTANRHAALEFVGGYFMLCLLFSVNLVFSNFDSEIFFRFLLLIVFFITLQNLASQYSNFFLCGLLIGCAGSLASALLVGSYSEETFRFDFLGIHPNLLGMYAFVSVLLVWMLSESKLHRTTAILVGLFASSVFSSRASFLAILIFSVVYLFLFSKKNRSILIVGFLLVCAIILTPISDMFADVLLLNDEHRGLSSGFSGRSLYWELAFMKFLDSPYFGSGFGTVEKQLGIPIDNGYLLLFAELGIFGALVYVSFLLHYIYSSFRLYRKLHICFFVSFLVSFMFYIFFERRYMAIGNPLSVLLVLTYFMITTQRDAEHD